MTSEGVIVGTEAAVPGDVKVAVEPVVFKRARWPMHDAGRGVPTFDLEQMKSYGGTWLDVRKWSTAARTVRTDKGSGLLLALYSCPACLQLRILVDTHHSVDPDGKVTCKDADCGYGSCGYVGVGVACKFERPMILAEWSDKRRLYAAVVYVRGDLHALGADQVRPGANGWVPAGTRYVHASDIEEARTQYRLAHDPRGVTRFQIAPVVGFFVDAKDVDKEKRVMTADEGDSNGQG